MERGHRSPFKREHSRHRLRGVYTRYSTITLRGAGRSDLVVEYFLSDAHPFKHVGDRDVAAVRAKDVIAIHKAGFGMLGKST